MDTIELIVALIKNGEFHSPEIKKLLDKDGHSFYELNWKKNDGTFDSVTSFSITFKFDMDSFLKMYHEMFPQSDTTEERVKSAIAMIFEDIAHLVFSSGRDNFRELAKILEPILIKKRGQLIGKDFGV